MSRSPFATPDVGVWAWARVGDDVDARHKARFGHAFRRIGRYVKLAQVGAVECLAAAGGRGTVDPRRVGVYLGSGLGNVVDIVPLAEGILDPARRWSSPIAFAGCVGNAAAFYVARALELDGPNVTVSQEELSFEGALLEAVLALGAGRVDRALVGGVDVLTGEPDAHRPRVGAVGVDGDVSEGAGWILLGPGEGAPARITEVWMGAGDPVVDGEIARGWRVPGPGRETRLSPTATALRMVEALEAGLVGETAFVQRSAGGRAARVRLAAG